jgi:hypothetical protein
MEEGLMQSANKKTIQNIGKTVRVRHWCPVCDRHFMLTLKASFYEELKKALTRRCEALDRNKKMKFLRAGAVPKVCRSCSDAHKLGQKMHEHGDKVKPNLNTTEVLKNRKEVLGDPE